MHLKRKVISAITAIFISVFLLQGCSQHENEIVQVVKNQLKLYPESSLQDIYKNFFQDEYGPGHLIENVSYAREYFDLELEEMASHGNHNAEPCGAGKNFYRVPMDLVKDEIISSDDYFNAFLESASSFTKPDVLVWKNQWTEIVNVIEKMDIDIPNFEEDKEALYKWLERGETMVHHSQAYSDKYDPHYRIIGKVQWEKLKGSMPKAGR